MATNNNQQNDTSAPRKQDHRQAQDSGLAARDAEDSATASPVPARREISGPGAADFLTATGGLDMPENDPSKGMRGAREDGTLTDERRLTPHLDDPQPTTEREILSRDGDKPRESK